MAMLGVAAGATCLGGFLYFPSLDTPFHADDYVFLGQLFQHGPWTSLWILAGRHFIPGYRLAVAVQAAFFGTEPWGYHLCSVLLHMLNALLVCWLGIRLTGRAAPGVAGALLFAFHPATARFALWSTCVAWSIPMACTILTALALFGNDQKSDSPPATARMGRQALAGVAFLAGLCFHGSAWAAAPIALLIAWSKGVGRRFLARAALTLVAAGALYVALQAIFEKIVPLPLPAEYLFRPLSDPRMWSRAEVLAPAILSGILQKTFGPFSVASGFSLVIAWLPPIAGLMLLVLAALALLRTRLAWVGMAVYAGCWAVLAFQRPLVFNSIPYPYFPLLGLALITISAVGVIRQSRWQWVTVGVLALCLPFWAAEIHKEVQQFDAKAQREATVVDAYRPAMQEFLAKRQTTAQPVVFRNDPIHGYIYPNKETIFHFLFRGVEGIHFAPAGDPRISHLWTQRSVTNRARLRHRKP